MRTPSRNIQGTLELTLASHGRRGSGRAGRDTVATLCSASRTVRGVGYPHGLPLDVRSSRKLFLSRVSLYNALAKDAQPLYSA
jgi:hypothetical protein